MRPLLAGAGILGLIVLGYSAANKYLAVKAKNSKKPAVKPEKIQRWEGEGGALPVTGSQLGPEPATPSNI